MGTSLLESLEADRAHLFALAYRMLGTAAEAEDVLQEAALRAREAQGAWTGAARAEVGSPRAWLTTVVTRLCLDQLKSARRQREEYVGPWLPEPLLTDALPPPGPDARVGLAESVSFAFLVLLERLTPLERAVFLLREVFEHDFGEVAALLERSEAACRQLFHRAKAHVEAGRPRFRPADAAAERLTRGFFEALMHGDAAALETLLAEDVRSWSDGGGKVHAARKPLAGRQMVLRLLLGLGKLARAAVEGGAQVGATVAHVNGQPALLVWLDGQLASVVVPEVDGAQVAALRIVANPDKLRRLQEAQLQREAPVPGAAP